ncbi:MAG: hypothetical protein HOO06_15285 [Bdellovibrionaceae bacterium]|jgi:hypothetical protein|nr:hypothetical protein [Pseudobdellovibrionaceae bacterium]
MKWINLMTAILFTGSVALAANPTGSVNETEMKNPVIVAQGTQKPDGVMEALKEVEKKYGTVYIDLLYDACIMGVKFFGSPNGNNIDPEFYCAMSVLEDLHSKTKQTN